jgi:predicted transcriptional regulator
MRNVARQSRSVAQQISQTTYRRLVLRFADTAELQADDLEHLALENEKRESDPLQDAKAERQRVATW